MVTCGYIRSTVTWMVLLSMITQQGYGWNLPNTYYQGADSGGYLGGRGTGSLGNQGLGGASAGSWSAGGVSNGAGGGGFQGQTGGGASGGFGANQWTGGDGSRATGGLAGGVSTASDGFGADGTGFQQAGGISSGAPLATGSEGDAGYNNQASLGNFGASNVGVGQYTPHHTNGPASDTNAFAGSFRPSGSGFGAGGHYHGSRPSTYGAPSVQLWRYGTPASYGGYGAARWPWHGHGYAYPVPVAHINPDGSYSFSYYTPHSSREETGHSNGNVEGTYGFQNDGAKHNFSFNAGPDVDLRSGVGDSRAGVLNPVEYGPQSVHSRARLPLVPQTTIQPGADDQTRTGDAGRGQVPNSWSSRSGVVEGANDQSSLAVVGLPKASSEASDVSQPTVATTARNQIVRGSTESVGAFDLEGRELEGTVTTTPPLGGSVEQVVTRPENEIPSYSNEIAPNDLQYNGVSDGGYQPRFGAGTPNIAQTGAVSPDRSYRFGYQTPDAAREETADQAGNVRGSFSYNNAAGRNDLQYVAGAGMGFRPTGGSLSVPNGLGGAGSVTGGPGRSFGGAGTGFGSSGVTGNQGGNFEGSSVGFGNSGVVGQGVGASTGGADTGFGGSVVNGNQEVGAGLGGNGVTGNLGGQGLGSTGVAGTGFGANGALGNQGGNFGGVGTGFGSNGVTGNFGGSTGGAGTDFGSNGVQGNQGGNFGGVGTGFGDSGVAGIQGGQGVGGNFGGSGTTGFGVERGAGVGGNFGGSTAGFGADGRPRAFGNQGSQVGLGGATGTGFGSDGRPLAFGNQAGGSFGGSNTGFGRDGRPLASGNQGGQLGSGARGTFGGFDGRSFAFGNQAGQGSTVGFTGTQGTTHNPVTRSPSPNGFNGVSAGQWNGSNTSGSVSSTEDRADESTTVNDDDSEQTTTFGGYGDLAGAGQFANGNRRLVQ